MADAGIGELFAAVEEGNAGKVKELIDKGISTNSFKDESHITPLHYCAQIGDAPMFKLLLENKANLREKDCWMDSVVHYACRYGNTNILELILKENASQKKWNGHEGMPNLLDLIGKECKVPISVAILNRHIPCVVMLFNAGAAIDIQDNTGKAPIDLLFDLPSHLQNDMFDKLMTCVDKMEGTKKFLPVICRYGDLHHKKIIQEKVDEILENFRQSDNEKWLEIFLQNDCVAKVKKLLKEPNYYTWNILESVLKKAVQCSNEEIVRLVLNKQTGIFADENCIKLCVENQSIEILKYLLKFPANSQQSLEEYEWKCIIKLALETGNVDVVKTVLDQCDHILHYAKVDAELWVKLIKNKYEELIKYLLNAGVKIDDAEIIYHGNKTPLTAAIESKNATLLKLIIAAGAKSNDPQSSLELGITTQNIEIVKLALTLPGSHLNDQKITRAAIRTKNLPFLKMLTNLGLGLISPDDRFALELAVETEQLNIVQLVYNSGARFSNNKDEIWKAIEYSSQDILDFLLQRCSIFKLRKKKAWTPLHQAVMQDNLEIVKLIMKYMPRSEINLSGHTAPLLLAILRKNIEITKCLISAGLDINKGGNKLFHAVVSGSEEIVSILLKAGISTYLDTKFGLTMIHVAVIQNNVNIVKQLLQLKYININAKVDLSHTMDNQFQQKYGDLYDGKIKYWDIKNETTALQLAVKQNSEDLVQELLNHNADITIANKMGCLPWVEALFNCNNILMNIILKKYQPRDLEKDINALCEIEINPILKGRFDKPIGNGTPLYFALSLGNLEGVKILLKHGASVSRINSNGETAIFGLTLLKCDRKKVLQGLKILIKKGANINHVNDDGSTVINKAVKEGNHELVNVLILKGADIHSVKTETLLQSVLYSGDKYICYMKIIHLLLQHGYHFQHISKLGQWLLYLTSDDNYFNRINLGKVQGTICKILDHMKSVGFDIKNTMSTLLPTSAKYNLQILRKYLLSEGCDVNVSYKCPYSSPEKNPLDVALENRNFPLMKRLLDAGEKCVDDRSVLNTVLKKAADVLLKNFCLTTAKLLVDNLGNELVQANPTIVHKLLKLFMQRCGYVTEEEIIDLMKWLIEKGLNINSRDENDRTALHHAAIYNAKHVVKFLVERQCDVRCTTYEETLNTNCTALEFAIHNINFEIADILLSCTYSNEIMHSKVEYLILDVINFDKNLTENKSKRNFLKQLINFITSESSYTNLLETAVSKSDYLTVTMLLEKSCRIYDDNKKNMVSVLSLNLISASKVHSVQIMEKLINAGAEFKFEKRATPLHYICALPNIHECTDKCFKMLKILIKKGCMTNIEDEDGKLPLHYAITDLNYDAVKLLVEAGSLIAPYGSHGASPLGLCCSKFNDCQLGNCQSERVTLITRLLLETGKAFTGNIVPAEVIHGIVMYEREEIMFHFSKYRIELEYNDSDGNKALHVACANKNSKILSMLLDRKCEVNAQNKERKTPLLLACEQNKYKFVKLLVEHGAKPDVPDNNGITPIHMCIIEQLNEAVSLLLKKPCNVNHRTKYDHVSVKAGSTPLVTALTINSYISSKSEEIAEKLIDMGADVNICNEDGDSPLHIAIRNKCKESTLRKLLRCSNIALNKQNNEGSTPLLLACEKRKDNFVQLLVDNGAKLDVSDNNGITPIHMCVIQRLNNVVTLLLNKMLRYLLSRCVNNEVNAQNNEGKTSLLLACENKEYTFVKLLLENGANPDIPDNIGITPIHMCIIISQLNEAFSLLLNKPFNVNVKTKSDYNGYGYAQHRPIKAGSTPLITAMTMNTYNSRKIAQQLLDVGADVDICNEDGDSALHIAIRNRYQDSFLINLLSKTVNISIQNNNGWSILHMAVKNLNPHIVQLILNENCDVNAKIDNNSEEYPGSTALHIAVHHTNVSLVEMLLKAGASMFKKDANGITSMQVCAIADKVTLWPMLIKAGGSFKALVVNMYLLRDLQKSNLLDLLIESGCALHIRFQGHNLPEPEQSLLAGLFDKQLQPLSLTRLAANTVRTNIYPNALYNSRKLPLPEIVKGIICFDDLDVNQSDIGSFSQQAAAHLCPIYQVQHNIMTSTAPDSDDGDSN